MTKIIVEIVCGNIESVVAAQQGGADRIELCDNLHEGGTTPDYLRIEAAKKIVSAPIHVMIRPRGGNFLYSDVEFEIMKQDMKVCRQLNVEGVVTGILNMDGSVDKNRTKELVALAGPMPVTFHRAFDITDDPFRAMEDIIDCGCRRILTSGQQPTAIEGAEMISELNTLSKGRIIILPGGGIRPENVALLIEKTKPTEIHSSAKEKTGEITDAAMVKSLKQIVSSFVHSKF